MNGGNCGVLMLQTCKNWQLESLAKLPPLLDVSVVGVYLTKYILRGLEHQRLNDLVFVQYNLRLRHS